MNEHAYIHFVDFDDYQYHVLLFLKYVTSRKDRHKQL